MKRYLLSFLFLSSLFVCSASVLSEKAKVYLFTCQPGQEVYAKFGHTAIYFHDEQNEIDYVFNYGIFSFDEEDFLYNFVKGNTIYELGVQEYDRFLWSYNRRSIGIFSQELNLTQQEKENLFFALSINAQPENRKYLYNFFYDNCATRPRDMVENAVAGKIIYSVSDEKLTYRDLVEMYVGKNTWLKFGIDLLIGAPADDEVTNRQKMFLPDFVKNDYKGAIIERNGETQALVKSTEQILPETIVDNTKNIFTPLFSCFLFLFLVSGLSYFDYKRKKLSIWFDFVTYLIAGIAGLLVFFITFISIHPTVFPNYNILWLHPVHLIFAVFLLIKCFRSRLRVYQYVNLLMLVLAIFFGLFLQQFNIAFFPLIIAFALRSLLYLKIIPAKK